MFDLSTLESVPHSPDVGITEAFARSVMSLNEGAKTRVGVAYELSEEFEVKVGMDPSCLFAFVVDVVTELSREGVLSEFLCADDFVLMSETIERLMDGFIELQMRHLLISSENGRRLLRGKVCKLTLGK